MYFFFLFAIQVSFYVWFSDNMLNENNAQEKLHIPNKFHLRYIKDHAGVALHSCYQEKVFWK